MPAKKPPSSTSASSRMRASSMSCVPKGAPPDPWARSPPSPSSWKARRGYALSEEVPTPMTDNGESKTSAWNIPEFRPDLAFPKLTEEMVERLGSYGREETLPANIPLFTYGERQGDMFVVVDGE